MEISHLMSFPLKDGSLRGFMTDTSCNKLELQPNIEILLQEQTPFLYIPMKAKWAINSDSLRVGTDDTWLKKKGVFCKCKKIYKIMFNIRNNTETWNIIVWIMFAIKMVFLCHSINVSPHRATSTERGSHSCTLNQLDASQLQHSIWLRVRAMERKAGWDFQTGICLNISLGGGESTHWATCTWPLG